MSTFPLLDEEPPALTTRQRLSRLGRMLLVLVVLAGLGVGGWAVYGAVTGASRSSSSGGKVLVVNSIRQLALADPDGSHQQPFTKFGLLAGNGGVYASPDGKTLLTDQGQLVMLRNGKPVTLSTALYVALDGPAYSTTCTVGGGVCYFNTGQILTLAPFANHGADIVYTLGAEDGSGPNVAEIVGLDGKHPQKLGAAVDYAGDPQEAAAFVTVPAPSPVQRVGAQGLPVTAVEHRVAGGATTTVVTTGQLANELKQLGLAYSDQMAVDISPDPTGKTIAIVPRDARSGQALALFVYTRTGQLLAHTPAAPTSALFWSPSGKQLLFTTANGADVWTPGQPPQTIPLPNTTKLLGNCVWSPDGKQVACVSYGGIGQHDNAWVLIDITHHTARAYPAAGLPILWEK